MVCVFVVGLGVAVGSRRRRRAGLSRLGSVYTLSLTSATDARATGDARAAACAATRHPGPHKN